METPSFYAIIPAHVRYCKELEPSAKLLYGEITALCSVEGYCWATNKYFSDLYGVDSRTITNWLRSLKILNFIRVEVEVDGIQRSRKIWISPEIKKVFTKGKKFPDVGKKISPRREKKFPYINTTSTTPSKETPPTPSRGDVELYGKFVQLTKEELVSLADQFGKEKTLQVIEEINDYLASTGKKPYQDYAATIRNWMRRRKNEPTKSHQTLVEKNRDWAVKVRDTLKHPDVEIFPESIGFVNHGAGQDLFISFKDLGFKDQVLSRLRKMNLPISGL